MTDVRDTPADILGSCPECGETVTRGCVLIEYESGNVPAVFAECPDCRTVVKIRAVDD